MNERNLQETQGRKTDKNHCREMVLKDLQVSIHYLN